MQGRTFLRIMFNNLFVNNALCRALVSFVNFCNEQRYYNRKELKFLENLPLNNVKNNGYSKKFIFTNNSNSGASFK